MPIASRSSLAQPRLMSPSLSAALIFVGEEQDDVKVVLTRQFACV